MTGQELIKILKVLINSKHFIDRHRKSKSSFIRKRKLTFTTLISSILKLITKSLHIECELIEQDVNKIAPSKQAFSKARSKMEYTGFKEIADTTVTAFYTKSKTGLWRGYRLIASDGSTIRLPNAREIEENFNRYKTNQYDTKMPILGRVSTFMDLCCGMLIDVKLGPHKIGEREMAAEQLPVAINKLRSTGQDKCLFIYDRGYISEEAIDQHARLGVDFLFRIPRGCYKQICKAIDKGERDFITMIGQNEVRVVALALPSGELEVLVTSLLNKQGFSISDFGKLYQLRWRIEECYKRLKVVSELENFSGTSLGAVLQDFWAHVALCNILTVFIRDKEEPWDPEVMPKWRLNFAVLLGSTRERLRETLLGKAKEEEFIALFNRITSRAKVKFRPGRIYIRAELGKPKRKHIYRRVC